MLKSDVYEVLLSHQLRSQRAQSQSALFWPDPPPLPLYIYTLSSQLAWGCSTPPRSLILPCGSTHRIYTSGYAEACFYNQVKHILMFITSVWLLMNCASVTITCQTAKGNFSWCDKTASRLYPAPHKSRVFLEEQSAMWDIIVSHSSSLQKTYRLIMTCSLIPYRDNVV